jgi:DNA-binding transcriptional ArsR family regulator
MAIFMMGTFCHLGGASDDRSVGWPGGPRLTRHPRVEKNNRYFPEPLGYLSMAEPRAGDRDALSSVFQALADPTRRAILVRLAGGDATVGELAEPFDMSQPAISKHLKVLEGAGLISRSRLATARLSHLEPHALRAAEEWLLRYADPAGA